MSDGWPNLEHMARALALAEMGKRSASPNPMVGAVVVRDGRVVGEGYHERRGGPHAEAIALSRAGMAAKGADLYVTLEPCFHSGEGKLTPPCTPLVIASGVRRVAVGVSDPNPRVSGQGIATIRAAGIEVVQGLCVEAGCYLNRGFFSRMSRGRPWVTAKWAMSLDGRTATAAGESKWISSEVSRRSGHGERAESDAIVVGIRTVLADDPMLTVRLGDEGVRQPRRVVVDPSLRLPLTSKLVQGAQDGEVFVVTRNDADAEKARALKALCVRVIDCKKVASSIDLADMLSQLGALGVNRILMEGGSGLIGSAFDQGVVDEALVFVAPTTVIGGASALGAVGGEGVQRMAECRRAFRSRVHVNESGDIEARSVFVDPTQFVRAG